MKKGRISFVALAVLLVLLLVTMLGACGIAGKGATVAEASESEVNQDATIRGIYTSLSISINGGNGRIWTTVKNEITIFPATVYVIVELYSSENFTESYQNMKLEATNQIGDLNVGKTIKAEASTNGVQKYWLGRTRYKVDNGAWKEMNTGICLYDANGNFIRYA